MSAPLVPSPLDYLRQRRFAFFPPIRSAEPNDWLLGLGSWGEVQVVNAQNGTELWIPRSYVGGISGGVDTPPVVELREQLEYRAGELSRKSGRVLSMPAEREGSSFVVSRMSATERGPAEVVGIRLEASPSAAGRIGKALWAAVAVGVLAAVLSALLRA